MLGIMLDMEATQMSMDKDEVHIYNGILVRRKKDEIMSFTVTWMVLEIIILSEVSQRQMYDIMLMWNLNKMTQMK